VREETGGHGTCLEHSTTTFSCIQPSLCSSPSLSITSQRSHIPYTRNTNISKRSCHCHCCHPVQSSPHTRLSQACLVGTKIQYLQASKQRLAHHHRRTGSVGCKLVAVVPCRVTNKFMLSNRGLLGEQCRRARMHDLSRGPKWWAALTDPVAERGGEGHEQRRDHVTSDVRPNDSVREFRNA
jgi:hypothetical protein